MMTIDQVLSLARPGLRDLRPYSSARDEFDQATTEDKGLTFLDANESPYPTEYNRYPDPHQRELKKVIGSIKSVAPENIFIGNGSDEAIDLLIRLFCTPGYHNIMIPAPTYGMYSVSAAVNDIAVKTVSLTKEFDLDSNKVLEAADEKSRMIFLCTPNNPTGNTLSRNAIESILENFPGLVVIDEAYIDFTTSLTWLGSLQGHANLVVLQTLSKAWGLAGLRLGMAFAHSSIIGLINKIKPPYNISSVAQHLAIRTLSDQDTRHRHVTEILKERSRLARELASLGTVSRVFPTEANFLLTKVNDASRAYQFLVQAGVVVRDRSKVTLCEECLRITVGTPDENNRLLTALASYE